MENVAFMVIGSSPFRSDFVKADRHHMIVNNSGRSQSIWMEETLPFFSPLTGDTQCDVCIVGGGIAGLSCAYTLAKQGKSVIVVDQGVIGGGQTARTTAHLIWVLDDRFHCLEKLFGEEGARLAAKSHAEAIDTIERISLEENIGCDFERVDGYLFCRSKEAREILEKEWRALNKIGMGVEKVENAPFSKTFHSGECLRFQNQAQFHIIKYLQGLTKAILKHGGKIFGESHVSHVEDGSPCLVKTEGGTIYAQSVIMATCSPVNNRFLIHTKQAGYRTYVIAASIPKGEIKKALYWDTEDPYHYIRTLERDAESEWVIVGGEDHKTGQGISSDRLYEHLEKWARERFHKMGKIQYRWSGQVFEPIDSLSFIGKNPGDKNIYVVTGDSGNGLTHGTIAGILIPALLSHKTHPWEKLYDPSRISFLATGDFVAENVNTALQYKDWFTPGEKKKVEALPTDKGIVLRKGLKKIAVYKDENNEVHVHSAFCPHLGGCVRWNDGEKSWDCPCHASRFDAKGNVITGPALCGLKKCAKC